MIIKDPELQKVLQVLKEKALERMKNNLKKLKVK